MKTSDSAEKTIKDIKRATRRRFSPEDKIRIVIEGIRGEDSIAAICRRESIHPNQYYKWSKRFFSKPANGAFKAIPFVKPTPMK